PGATSSAMAARSPASEKPLLGALVSASIIRSENSYQSRTTTQRAASFGSSPSTPDGHVTTGRRWHRASSVLILSPVPATTGLITSAAFWYRAVRSFTGPTTLTPDTSLPSIALATLPTTSSSACGTRS